MFIRSEIIGTGSYLPEKVITNFDMEKLVDTTDQWIQERTGIKERHVAAENQFTSDLAYKAGEKALKKAGMNASELELIIVATTTPDNILPATATKLQALLGAPVCAAFDVQAACSGFIYALHIADSLIKSGQYKNALVVGAESMSKLFDWKDRNTCVLFGDGAGAVVLKAVEVATNSVKETGIIDNIVKADGTHYDKLKQTGGVSNADRGIGYMHMEGREVYKHAVVNLAEVAEEILERNNVSTEEVDWFIPHQANLRIIESSVKKLKFSLEKTITTVYYHANTSAASIPLAIDEAVKESKLKKGDLILLDGMGAGFTWGASLVRF